MKTLKLSLLGILFTIGASAQSDLLLYNFNGIAQSLHVNPADSQQTRVWVALPGISGVQASYHNNGFALIDLFERGTKVNANKDRIILSLGEKSQLAVNQSTDLLGVGFRAFKGFATIGATQQVDFRMGYPSDLLRLINFGNVAPENRNLNVGDFRFETMIRTNYYIGYQRKYNEKLRLGGRIKLIVGQAHSYAERMNATIITTDSSSLVAQTDVLVRTAGFSNLFNDENTFGFGSTFFQGNIGMGIDLGGSYDLNEKWNISASVLDLGFIKWKTNTRDYISKGEFQFDGIEADLSQKNPIESFDGIVDSLEKAFNFRKTDGNSYTKSLSSRVFAAVNYEVNPKHTFGLLYHGRIWESQLFNDISVNYQARLSRFFQLSVNYSVINGTYNNVGAGFFIKAGPMQLYVMSDNVLHAIMYENLQTSSVRAGLNIALFAKKKKTPKSGNSAPAQPKDND